jgi:hypothetical protein
LPPTQRRARLDPLAVPKGVGLSSPEPVAQAYARFASCGVAETHVVDANADPDEVANHVLAAFRDGRLAVG